MMKALNAMMSGQTPKQFLSSLPQLKGMNLDNLEQTARDLCNKNGINMEQKLNEIKDFAKSQNKLF